MESIISLWKTFDWSLSNDDHSELTLSEVSEILCNFGSRGIIESISALSIGVNSRNYKIEFYNQKPIFLKQHITVRTKTEINWKCILQTKLQKNFVNVPHKALFPKPYIHYAGDFFECFQWYDVNPLIGAEDEFYIVAKAIAKYHKVSNQTLWEAFTPSEVYWYDSMAEVFQASKKLGQVNSILPTRTCLALQELSSVLYKQKMDQAQLYFCHGDLHTGNISIIRRTQEPIIFDQGVARYKRGGQAMDIGIAFHRMIRLVFEKKKEKTFEIISKYWMQFIDGYTSQLPFPFDAVTCISNAVQDSLSKIISILTMPTTHKKNYKMDYVLFHITYICELLFLWSKLDDRFDYITELQDLFQRGD